MVILWCVLVNSVLFIYMVYSFLVNWCVFFIGVNELLVMFVLIVVVMCLIMCVIFVDNILCIGFDKFDIFFDSLIVRYVILYVLCLCRLI